jgi:hypothetical protein
VGFTVRAEGKRYAERMASLLADASSVQVESYYEESEDREEE